MKRAILIFTVVVSFFIVSGFSQELVKVPEIITKAITEGNAENLAKYFNSNLEFVINNSEEVYSKAQAEIVLKQFFENNQPKSFTIVHEGTQGKLSFVIGKLVTEQQQQFRIHFLLTNISGKWAITRFTIDKN